MHCICVLPRHSLWGEYASGRDSAPVARLLLATRRCDHTVLAFRPNPPLFTGRLRGRTPQPYASDWSFDCQNANTCFKTSSNLTNCFLSLTETHKPKLPFFGAAVFSVIGLGRPSTKRLREPLRSIRAENEFSTELEIWILVTEKRVKFP